MPRPPEPQLATVLIADAGQWSGKALESVLSDALYQVAHVRTAAELLAAVRRHTPDVIFVSTKLPGGTPAELADRLRAEPQCGPTVPIIVTSAEHMPRSARMEALEAGAWLTLTYPFDAEELLAQLDCYVAARRRFTEVTEESFVDEATELYSRRGLQHRGQELQALALRHRQPIACVVFAPVPAPEATNRDEATLEEAVRLWGKALRVAGRRSDAVGRYGPAKFAVIAPNTGTEAATGMARRLGAVLRSAGTQDGRRRYDIRAGYEVVEDPIAAPMEVNELLEHAERAVGEAQRSDSGDWILPYGSEG
jgi:PleD family two-component response regulator